MKCFVIFSLVYKCIQQASKWHKKYTCNAVLLLVSFDRLNVGFGRTRPVLYLDYVQIQERSHFDS